MMFIIGIYCVFMIWTLWGIHKKSTKPNQQQTLKTYFSVVVVFRNESTNLNNLLNSFVQLDYPIEHFEILMINDDSTDNSTSIIKSYQKKLPNLKLFQNNRCTISPKKDGIVTAIKNAAGTWIAVTDADCIVPKNWLSNFNQTIIQRNALLIAGPVVCKTNKTILRQYQQLEFIALMGITMGTMNHNLPTMCNGANLAYEKKTYLQIVDFNKKQTVSGDDIDILESFQQFHPKKIKFIHNSLVYTKALTSWKNLIQQKIRWAAKSTQYKNLFTKLVGITVLFTQLTIFYAIIFQTTIGLSLLFIKMVIDFIIIDATAKKLNQPIVIGYYVTCSLFYPFINSYIGIKSLLGHYEWKGRKFNR